MKSILNFNSYKKTEGLKNWDKTKSIEVLNNIIGKKIKHYVQLRFYEIGV